MIAHRFSWLVVVLLFSPVDATHADVRLAKVLGDHMVLQRDQKVRVWGWAEPGEQVAVQFGGQSLAAQADREGAWSVALAPMRANAQPQDLTVRGRNTLKLTDILVGDVWLLSGQSNAGFGLGGCNAEADIKAADLPGIRFFGYWEHFASAPCKDVKDGGGAAPLWRAVSPQTAAQCPAMGFYFARAIYREAGVPIGILTCCVGGTEIECWLSPEAINNYPENTSVAKAYRDAVSQWESDLAQTRTAPGGNRPAFLAVDQPIGIDVAVAWIAQVRAALQAAGTAVDPSFAALENWVKSAQAAVQGKRPVPVPPDFGIVGNWLLTTPLPANLKRIPLAPHPLEDRWGIGGHGWFRTQSLYNGMIHPLASFAVKGMIWYQGENGSGTAYGHRFHSMVETMRAQWKHEFPVYFVQIANWRAPDQDPAGGDLGWPITRMAQLLSLQVPKTGMAVAIDIGDAEDIHPKNKFDVGERLALWAFANDYGKTGLVCSGPLYKAVKTEGGKMRILFDSVGSGLMVGKKDGLKPTVQDNGARLQRFAIAGEDRTWVWADAVIDGKTVVVSSPAVLKPVAVRYAFSMNPQGCNLYNREGLPASPFRTDDW